MLRMIGPNFLTPSRTQPRIQPNTYFTGREDTHNGKHRLTNRDQVMIFDKRKLYPAEFLSDLTPNMCILDVGCGTTGEFIKFLRGQGCQYAYGIDSDERLEKEDYLYKAAFPDCPFANGSFDRIFSTFSIMSHPAESLETKKAALVKMEQLLKPGGKIRLSPVDAETIESFIADIPSLRITGEGSVRLKHSKRSYIELTKSAE